MSPEQESVFQRPSTPPGGDAADSGSRGATPKSSLVPTRSPAGGDPVELRVSWLRDGECPPENPPAFRLTANHWERLEIPLSAAWRGGVLRLEPGCRFGMIEIVGARVVSSVRRETLWEKLGCNLAAGVQPSAGTLVLSNQFRLRLLHTGGDAQITLPDPELPGSDVPRLLELGLRVRTDLAAIGYTLQDWVADADARRQETAEQLAAAEGATAAGEKLAKTLLAEIEMARAHGDERAAALRQEVANLRDARQQERRTFEQASAAQRQMLAKLHGELAEARRSGEEQLGRVRSMQRSLSWRLTLPWRIVARLLTGRRPAGRRQTQG